MSNWTQEPSDDDKIDADEQARYYDAQLAEVNGKLFDEINRNAKLVAEIEYLRMIGQEDREKVRRQRERNAELVAALEEIKAEILTGPISTEWIMKIANEALAK